ncbi:MAG: WYL domain-containing protein [Nostocales cyanobacterium 94392]|nr:WYL domain-containing protein [Nostocales cyanobacterium 94392]
MVKKVMLQLTPNKLQQKEYPIAHFLIGIPGSGKSTFAKLLSQQGNYQIISTDDIRTELYGDATIQGDWKQIETEAIQRIYTSLQTGKRIIYDATNFKRALRLEFLQKVKQKLGTTHSLVWIGWYLNTPLSTSILWNQNRDRQVPESILQGMHEILQNFPPITAEGFTLINTVDITSPKFSVSEIEKLIKKLPRSIINSQNRKANITLHQYSNFLDFEKLLHLISLIIKYPGIGNLQNSNPDLLEKILGYKAEFSSDIQEITAIVAKERGNIYACENAINDNLKYLATVGILPELQESSIPLSLTRTRERGEVNLHSYSEQTVFNRLIGTIRLIVNNPYLNNNYGGSLPTLAKSLEEAGTIYNAKSELATIRKDIEKVLKPYQILPSFPMRKGYCAGTGILSQQELIKVFEILQSQANSLDDPLALDLYNTFKQKMLQSKFINPNENIYPVRSITNNCIIDEKYLHETSLFKKLPYLEDAIINGKLIEFSRFSSSAKYQGDAKSFIQVYPLQIIFHNLAWYLGYECVKGEEEPGLLRFERLDRLFLGNLQNQSRSRQQQEKALENLHKLIQGGAGIFLGNSVTNQQKFLSSDKKTHSQACVTVELWFNDKIYHFITEGPKRFSKIKMARPKSSPKVNLPKSIFFWDEPTEDKDFPNRFQVILTKWSLQDFDLWRWIIGFGANVKVIKPPELVEKIKQIGQGIADNY